MTWAQVLTIFLRAAFLSVNGSTTLALLKEDLVDRLQVLSPADFSLGVAVGAITPGPLGYGAIALGFLADGWRGALIATGTSWLPAFLAIPLRRLYGTIEGHPRTQGVNWGIGAAGMGLLLALVISLAVTTLTGWREAILGGVLLVLLAGRCPIPAVIVLAAAGGVLFL